MQDGQENQRRHIRHPLTGDLTGAIIAAKSGSLVPCIATDVSKIGLRITLSLDFKIGTELILRLHGEEIRLSVIWCTKDPSTRKGYFACGLKALDEAVDLVDLFTRQGWLDELKDQPEG
jgi:hypothetical protein